jgi:hypothetical protein
LWKQLYAWTKQLLFLSRDTRQSRLDVQDLREELARLTVVVQKLAFEIHRLNDKMEHARALEAHEREKMALRLENEMLRSERRLTVGEQRKE